MKVRELLGPFPLRAPLLTAVVVIFLAVEIGYRWARHRRRSEEEKEAPVGATLSLLAFRLAFIFGLAAAHFDDRRQVAVAEANAFGTTDRRAARPA